tara:strand:- start:958 stop:1158 length:201 start_codon:yes stop_codon:yes gene_type:complete
MDEKKKLIEMLKNNEQEHSDLDQIIYDMNNNKTVNLMQIRRLKKRKLFLKDKIKSIKNELEPDIIA